MRVEFDSSEKEIVLKLNLPPGTDLLESKREDDHDEPLFWYTIDDSGKMIETRDIVEFHRNPTPEEKDLFKDMPKEELLNWWALTYNEEAVPYWKYSCMIGLLHGKFNYLRCEGMIPATGQRAFEVMCYKRIPVEEQLAEINMVIPLIKEVELPIYSDEDEKVGLAKYLGIFEHTLSEGGIYELHIFESVIEITKTIYGHTSLVKKFETVEDAITYICKKLYYQEEKRW